MTEVYDGTVAAAANPLLARDAVFAGLGSRNAATNASGIDLDGDNRVDRMFTTQGSGGTSTGVTATDRAGSTVGSATVQRPPLRLASSAPRATSGDVIWGPVRPLITTASGLQYREIVIGTGATPTSGQTATVHYVGSRQKGAVFGSSRESGTPLSVRLQQPVGSHPGPTGTDAGLILGWIEALEGMRVGGRHTLIIPANLAYGDDPPPNSGIQPGDTLVFDIELLAVAP